MAKGAEPKLSARLDKSEAPPAGPRREHLGDGSALRSPERPRVDPAPAKDAPTPAVAEGTRFDDKTSLETVLPLSVARESARSKLEALVVVCRKASKTYQRAGAAVEWAATRNNLASALVALDESKNGTTGLEEAVALYREALKERTRENAPRDWATIQNNLGEALTILGLRTNEVGKLAEAAAVKREALDWAKRTGDEGVALMHLAERLSDKDIARTALAQIDMALATIQGGDHASLVGTYFEEQLPKARALVDKLSGP